MSKSFELQKEKAVNIFRELINTPHIIEIDISFHGKAGEPMMFEYKICRAVGEEVEE